MLPVLGCSFLHLVCHSYLNFGFYFRLLDSDREPIQDVPAIYFIMPTDDNIRRLCKVRGHFSFVSTFQVRSSSSNCFHCPAIDISMTFLQEKESLMLNHCHYHHQNHHLIPTGLWMLGLYIISLLTILLLLLTLFLFNSYIQCFTSCPPSYSWIFYYCILPYHFHCKAC